MRPEIKPVLGPRGRCCWRVEASALQGPPHTCQSQAGLRLTGSTKKRFMAGTNLPAPNSHGWVALNVVRYGEWDLTSFGGWHPRPPNAHPDLPGNRFGGGASFTAPAWHEPTIPWTGGTKIPPNPNFEPTYHLVGGTHFSTQPPNFEHEVHSVGGTNDGSNWGQIGATHLYMRPSRTEA